MVGLLTAFTAFLVPRALEPRLRVNERSAVEILRMLDSTQRVALSAFGRREALWNLAYPVQTGSTGNPPRSLMPRGFLLHDGDSDDDQSSIVMRTGYFFRQASQDGVPAGCWAWPKSPGYSGRRVFWVSYDRGTVHEVDRALQAAGAETPGGVPDAGLLGPPLAE